MSAESSNTNVFNTVKEKIISFCEYIVLSIAKWFRGLEFDEVLIWVLIAVSAIVGFIVIRGIFKSIFKRGR